MTEIPPFTKDDVARALSGDRAEARRLLAEMVPVVRVRVARVLWRYRKLSRKRDLTQEADDLAQEVLAYLFDGGGRVLRSWDPARGLELLDFVGFVTDRTASAVLKSGVRTPWRDDPTSPEELTQAPASQVSHADLLVSRDLAERVYSALRAELSPLGAALLQRLVIDESDVESVCRDHGMSRDAVYAWRSRLVRRLRELVAEADDSARLPVALRSA